MKKECKNLKVPQGQFWHVYSRQKNGNTLQYECIYVHRRYDVFKIFFSLFHSKKFQNFKKHLIFGFEANILWFKLIVYVVRINYGVDDEHDRVEVHQETIPDGRIMDQNLLNLFSDVKLQWGFNNDFDLKKKITLVLWEQTFSVVLLFTLHYNNADILVHKNFLS